MQTPARVSANDHGMSLASLLVLVVILGLMMVAAIAGVNSLTGDDSPTAVIRVPPRTTGPTGSTAAPMTGDGGSSAAATAACQASAAAATSASTAYFVGSGVYPAQWSDLIGPPTPAFVLPTGVVAGPGPVELVGPGWKLTMAGGGTTAPTFTCS